VIPLLRLSRCSLLRPGIATLTVMVASLQASEPDPWADRVVSYDPGVLHGSPFDDPGVAVGSPERFTGESAFPGAVTPFNPPYGTDEIVSIGAGGSLVIAFDEPVTDDRDNPFGIDLIIFSNSFFGDDDFPFAVVDGLAADPGTIEVSPDGTNWTPVPGVKFDALFPTLGYMDAGPYDMSPGSFETDFTLPVDPAITLGDLEGLGYPSLVAAYCGSGGGTGVDLTPLGLSSISFVRLSNPVGGSIDVEVDALSDVRARPPGDLSGSGSVGFQDLTELLGDWGTCPAFPTPCQSDLDKDGTVGFGDLTIVLNGWSL